LRCTKGKSAVLTFINPHNPKHNSASREGGSATGDLRERIFRERFCAFTVQKGSGEEVPLTQARALNAPPEGGG
jgi:hypothetical protein